MKLEVVTPNGVVEIAVWPSAYTDVTVTPNENHGDYCARGEHNTKITLKPRA